MSERSPRVALVQAPAFVGGGPCGALALLCADLRAAGLSPMLHDASLGVRKAMARRAGLDRPPRFTRTDDLLAELKREPAFFESAIAAETDEVLRREPDIVGFSVQTGTEECSLAMARRIKKLSPKTLVVFGGAQCIRETLAHELAQDGCVDAVALGDADLSFVDFVKSYRPGSALPRVPGFLIKSAGGVIDCGDAPEIPDLDALPFMDFSGFDFSGQGYEFGGLHLNGSRGCVRKCAFCTHILQHKVYRTMSAERMACEVEHHLRRDPSLFYISLDDSLINGDVARIGKFADLLVPLRLERAIKREKRDFGWGGMAIIHPTMTSGLLRRMRQGGCQIVCYGLESASQKVVDLMDKRFQVAEAARLLRDTRQAGIAGYLFLMVGFPGETEKDFQMTLDFLERHVEDIGDIAPAICEIQKGSALDRQPERFGIRGPVTNAALWETEDGSNTPAIRQERYDRLLEFGRRLGFRLGRRDFEAEAVAAP